MPHPPYSPELAHVILWLNQIIKSCMRGQLGDTVFKIFIWGNLVLRRCVSGAVKRDF